MPTLSEIQTEVLDILTAKPWYGPSSADAVISKERAKSVIFQFANLWQKTMLEQHVFNKLPCLFDTFLNIVAQTDRDTPFQYADSFEKELIQVMFTKLNLDMHIKGIDSWGAAFLQISTTNIATLIRQISYEVIQHGWLLDSDRSKTLSFFTWMKDQATMVRASCISNEQQLDLLRLSNRLSDPTFFSIPVNPRFCMNTGGRWFIFDEEALSSMLKANRDYRDRIKKIDDSGPTGIGYVLTQLHDDEDEVTQARDIVLATWYNKFPMIKYLSVETYTEQQQILYDHERWLDITDRILDWSVWYSLPKQVRQIAELRNQRNNEEAHLLTLTALIEKTEALRAQRDLLEVELTDENETESENEGELSEIDDNIAELEEEINQYSNLIDIREKIESINQQLLVSPNINDLIDLEKLKIEAVAWVHAKMMVNVENATPDSVLLNIDSGFPNSLTEAQLVVLVHQAVDALIARDGHHLTGDQAAQLRQHLDSRREKQLEFSSNAEGNLRTDATADGQLFILSENQIRDPIDRREYIDVDDSEDGIDFRDIIIGGCLWAAKMDPSFVVPAEIKSL